MKKVHIFEIFTITLLVKIFDKRSKNDFMQNEKCKMQTLGKPECVKTLQSKEECQETVEAPPQTPSQ